METATILLLVGCVAVGVVSAVLRTWSLHSRTYSLEDRIAIVEGTLQREVKTRAAQERWKKPDKTEALAVELLGKPIPTKQLNWWERPEFLKAGDGK
jgi:outer membrane biogenesis lipoprotein LolB